MKFARVTLSDRASAGKYEDLSGPEIERIVSEAGLRAEWHRHVMPDDLPDIEALLIRLCDEESCQLVVTTGGTGLIPA